ncbi:MAG: hypothetical protein DRP87_18545 [Spirochaetes bacterium]|nr:MAG: hypothetical protein DRP87_18545 [Spirochaetota bacterium]
MSKSLRFRELPFTEAFKPDGNDMIDAHVETLEEKVSTIAWKSLRLYHNHLDNCFAVTHISTGSATNIFLRLRKNEQF